MDRREFVLLGAAFLGAFIAGAIGGMTAEEDGRWGEQEPPP